MEEPQGQEQEEVIVLELQVDGRVLEFFLTDIQEILGKRYATLFCDDDFVLDEDRTIFAKIDSSTGEDKFEVLSDPIELEMVIANSTLNVVDDFLFGVREEVRQINEKMLSLEDPAELPLDKQKILGIIYNKVQNLLAMLDDGPEGVEDQDE